MNRETAAFVVSILSIATLIAWNSPAPTPPRDQLADGAEFVRLVDADRVVNPGRREQALNRCVKLDRDGRADWTYARNCYEALK